MLSVLVLSSIFLIKQTKKHNFNMIKIKLLCKIIVIYLSGSIKKGKKGNNLLKDIRKISAIFHKLVMEKVFSFFIISKIFFICVTDKIT
jgi:hypothetical protein